MTTATDRLKIADLTRPELEKRAESLEQLLGDIIHLAFKHEVQKWKDAPGTDAEKLSDILVMAREARYLVVGEPR